MQINRVCILGGTGFIGHHLTARLSRDVHSCRIVSRHPERYRELEVLPGVELTQTDSLSAKALEPIFRDCDAVINLIGILNEGGAETTFRRVHVDLIDQIIDACRSASVSRILHMSALNADAASGASEYLRSKGEGENRAHTGGGAGAAVTSFRPSVVFGPGDSFFNRFAGLLQLAPGIFPLACPGTQFAPVFVGDLVEAFARSLRDKQTFAKRYELCGPQVFTLKELVQYTAKTLGLNTKVVGLGDFASRLQARMMEFVPGKPFSSDNYLSLQINSLCRENGLETLGIHPTEVDTIVPAYLGNRTLQKRYQNLRTNYWDPDARESRRA